MFAGWQVQGPKLANFKAIERRGAALMVISILFTVLIFYEESQRFGNEFFFHRHMWNMKKFVLCWGNKYNLNEGKRQVFET